MTNRLLVETSLAMLVVAFCPAFGQAPQTMAPTPGINGQNVQQGNVVLSNFNNDFRQDYKRAKEEVLKSIGPVMIVEGDNLVLLKNGRRQEANVVPTTWHELKAVDHIALDVFVLLTHHTDEPLNNNNTIQRLNAISHSVEDVRNDLSSINLTAPQLARQKQILDLTTAFIKKVNDAGQISKSDLTNFCRKTTPFLLANADDDQALAIGSLNSQVQKWKKEMDPADWKSLHVVIMGGHMPRDQNSNIQYFSLLLQDKTEGHSWIYLESCPDEEHALDGLATHILDRSIAETFFNDPERMHRDFLADATRKYLEHHPISK